MSQPNPYEQSDPSMDVTTQSVSNVPGGCSTCGQSPQPGHAPISNYVYAIGKIEPRFPRQSIEKEFAQVVARTDTKELTDRQMLHRVLSNAENRYLARQMCWVLTIEGLDTYLLAPRDPSDLSLLVESLRLSPTKTDIDVVIGVRGPIAAGDMCNGLSVPIVIFDQIYSFDKGSLLGAIPRDEGTDSDQFEQSAAELLDRLMQMADNNGSTDSYRALNYLAVRYPAIYARVAEAFGSGHTLSAVSVLPSRLSGTRLIFDVVFSFLNRATDATEKSFARVDVTDEFPFLVTKLSPYYDR